MKRKALSSMLALAVAALAPPAAGAAEFTILIYEPASEAAARTDASRSTAYWAEYAAFVGELAQAGILRGGSALSETTSATVRGRGHAAASEPAARLGGYLVIDVADLTTAESWARRVPDGATHVEVRAHRPNPAMQPVAPRTVNGAQS